MGRDAQTNDKVFNRRPDWFPQKERYREALQAIFGDSVIANWIGFIQNERVGSHKATSTAVKE
tara:strand:+ start:1695 stop:1883 length:189 start_codon:yes stop_codon:yes gene_type:complete